MNARTEFPFDTADSSGLRRAALALHATHAEDRQWLVAKMPRDKQSALQKMLDDLSSLGLPPDRELVQDVLRRTARASADELAGEDALLRRLRAAPAAQLARLLQGEAASLAAHVVALLPSDRRTELLETMQAPRRKAVMDVLGQCYPSLASVGGTDLAPLLTQAVLQELAPRLGAMPAQARGWDRLRLLWSRHARGAGA